MPREPHRAGHGAARSLRRLTALALAVAPLPVVAQADTARTGATTATLEPRAFRDAVARGTRARTGQPGPRYWQQAASYSLSADYDPPTGLLRGAARIRYANRAPHALDTLWLAVPRGAPGARSPVATTMSAGGDTARGASAPGDVRFVTVRVRGATATRDAGAGALGYAVEGAALRITLDRPVAAGETVDLDATWTYVVPPEGAPRGGRGDGAHVVSDWYPRLAVHDDVAGWQVARGGAVDPGARPYAEFGAYDVAITVPTGWLVAASGALVNANEALAPESASRLQRARTSTDVVQVVSDEDRDAGRAVTAPGPRVTWRFRGDSLGDVAFATSDRYRWDAARLEVPGGDSALVQAFRLPTPGRRSLWPDAMRLARWGIGSHSRTLTPYAFPVATIVAGSAGCSAAFPTLVCLAPATGDDRDTLLRALFHELAHQWFPMTVGVADARRPWLDEGLATFNELEALAAFLKRDDDATRALDAYARAAGTSGDRAVLVAPDSTPADSAADAAADTATMGADSASLALALATKPALVMRALRGLLGDSMWALAYREFVKRWAFRHPTPYDFLRTVDDVSGQDLGWFWHAWLAGTGTLDQAVASVTSAAGTTMVRIESRGTVPMPARVKLTRADESVQHEEIPVQTWLAGARHADLRVPSSPRVVRVEIDPAGEFPDVDRANNVWTRDSSRTR